MSMTQFFDIQYFIHQQFTRIFFEKNFILLIRLHDEKTMKKKSFTLFIHHNSLDPSFFNGGGR